MRCFYCMEDYDEDIDVICPFCGNDIGELSNENFCLNAGSILKERYVVGRVLGNGGFGITYIGYDERLQRKVAVKEYFPIESATRQIGEKEVHAYNGERGVHYSEGLKSFVEEARRLANLGSIEGVVNVHDVFTENGTAYIVMEYLSGETVMQMINRRKILGFGTTMNIIVPVLRSLNRVHSLGLIHRDISPENIIRTTEGKIVLIDFGASRKNSLTMSKSLSIVLKQGYAPIEQYDNKLEQGSWTDVYATAATMYTMLTGVTPDFANTRLLSDNLMPVTELREGLPPQLDGILKKALAIRPEERTQTAKELLDELMTLKDFKRDKVRQQPVKNPEKTNTQAIPKKAAAKKSEKSQENVNWKSYVHERPIDSGAVADMEYKTMTVTSDQISEKNFKPPKPREIEEEPKSVKLSKPLIAVTILAFIVLGGLVGVGYLDRKNNIQVPEFIGQSIDGILSSDEYDFKFEVTNVYKPDTDLDVIIDQSPKSSSRHVKKDSTVRLTVNSLDTEVTIPVLSKLSRSAAVNTLDSLYLTSEIVVVQDDNYEEGSVIRTEPANGTKVKVMTKVTVYVAENSVSAPNLVGKLYEDAVTELEGMGLHMGEASYDYSEEYEAGYIMNQGVIKDSPLEKGSYIPVVVSLGKPFDVSLSATVDLSDLKAPFKISVSVDGETESEKTFYSLAFRKSYDFEVVRLNTAGSVPVNVYIDGELYQEYSFDFSSESTNLVAEYEVSATKNKGESSQSENDTESDSDVLSNTAHSAPSNESGAGETSSVNNAGSEKSSAVSVTSG